MSAKLKISTSREKAGIIVDLWREDEKRIVFTNGCFDILHMGHIQFLEEAKNLGDKLIIGVNSDESVKRLKGNIRPINKEHSRLYLLASLTCVDCVVLFDEDTPYELIGFLKPDILVKGGDYQPDEIVGSDLVLGRGGIVKSLQYVEGYSTSSIESKILQLHTAREDDKIE
jgi:rfaE bifunctional protein nucleotidyltransferase chain/domain